MQKYEKRFMRVMYGVQKWWITFPAYLLIRFKQLTLEAVKDQKIEKKQFFDVLQSFRFFGFWEKCVDYFTKIVQNINVLFFHVVLGLIVYQ